MCTAAVYTFNPKTITRVGGSHHHHDVALTQHARVSQTSPCFLRMPPRLCAASCQPNRILTHYFAKTPSICSSQVCEYCSGHTASRTALHNNLSSNNRAAKDTEKDLEAQMEEFMRRQAEAESGTIQGGWWVLVGAVKSHVILNLRNNQPCSRPQQNPWCRCGFRSGR